MKKKILLSTVVVVIIVSSLLMVACDNIVPTGSTVYNSKEFVSKWSVLEYRYDRITLEWDYGYISNAKEETLKKPNKYYQWVVYLKNSFLSDKKRLDYVCFMVTTEDNVTMTFSFQGGRGNNSDPNTKLYSQEVTFVAGEPALVKIPVGETIDILTFDYNAFIVETVEYYEKADGKYVFDGINYDCWFKGTETNFTVTDYQLVVTNLK